MICRGGVRWFCVSGQQPAVRARIDAVDLKAEPHLQVVPRGEGLQVADRVVTQREERDARPEAVLGPEFEFQRHVFSRSPSYRARREGATTSLRSMTCAGTPSLRSSAAAARPAGPAPMIRTGSAVLV